MKPDYTCKGAIDCAMEWYEELDYLERKAIDKKISNVQNYIRNRSRTQFSKTMGIELVYSVRERI